MGLEDFQKTLELGLKMKRKMLEKKIVRARAKCPDCPDKFLNAALAGPKNHLRFYCDCRKRQMME